VDARTGREQWRRPLGLTCQGDPIELGDAVVTVDPAGAIYKFDSTAKVDGPWSAAGHRLFPEIKDLIGEPQLLRSPDGRQVVFAAIKSDGPTWQLVLRQIGAHGQERVTSVPLPAPLAGTPAISSTAMVLPLADGSLARVPLTGESRRDIGPNWRALGARPDSRSHVLAWRGDEYLVFDGQRKLTRLRWAGGTQYELETAQAIELPGRLLGAPVRLPESGETPTALVADATGGVSLIRGPAPRIERTWRPVELVEQITAGPWIVGDRAYVVVANKKLVALDPRRETPLWTYISPGDGLSYAPALIDGRLIVADQAGSFLALDPATGAALGPGYRHPAEVAPAAAPVAFGGGRFFAPLTDGSVLVLPISELIAR
jgi:hypothetical protein